MALSHALDLECGPANVMSSALQHKKGDAARLLQCTCQLDSLAHTTRFRTSNAPLGLLSTQAMKLEGTWSCTEQWGCLQSSLIMLQPLSIVQLPADSALLLPETHQGSLVCRPRETAQQHPEELQQGTTTSAQSSSFSGDLVPLQ